MSVVTYPLILNPCRDLATALSFAALVCNQPNAAPLTQGQRHWAIFKSLSEDTEVKDNLILDTYLAALVIESGSTWVTTDRDYSLFPSLTWPPLY